MLYLDEMYPRNIIDLQKFEMYSYFHGEYEKFLKDLREMSYLDWLIEKKLVEAGGLGKRVYISLPRCNGKTFTLMKRMEELEAKGHEVYFTTSMKQYPWPKRTEIEKIKECVIDRDLYPLRDWRATPYQLELYRDFGLKTKRNSYFDEGWDYFISSAGYDRGLYNILREEWLKRMFVEEEAECPNT